jgi:hypothetical protein
LGVFALGPDGSGRLTRTQLLPLEDQPAFADILGAL